MCYTLMFLALVNQLDAPRMYQNGYFNTVEECESAMVQQSKKLFPNDEFIFKSTSKGLMGFYRDQKGNHTYYQCVIAGITHEVICDKGVLGNYKDCDCTQLMDETNVFKQMQ